VRRLSEGDRLGRYQIVRRLGAGAMGEVYLAEDPQIGRKLALKTVRMEEGKPKELEERKQRLLREARAAGKLLHPNIVTLFDVGEDGGLLYLAFEWIDGSDLGDRIESGPPLTLADSLAIVRQAAEGLDAAHRQGVIHRDIKPSNLMVTADGRVKVADFGIAKVLDSTSDLTHSGSVVGSPHYLSPEQIRGEALDGRTDIFSLGVLLYELLCRRRPFDGETLTTLVYQILNQEPTPIEARRPDLGPRIEVLVRRMMHKDRDQRFASAADLAAEIAACERELPAELLAKTVGAVPELSGATTRMPTEATTAERVGPPPLPTAPMATPPGGQTAATVVSAVTNVGAAPPALPPPPPAPAATARPSRTGLVVGLGLGALALLVVVGFVAQRALRTARAEVTRGAVEEAQASSREAEASRPTGTSRKADTPSAEASPPSAPAIEASMPSAATPVDETTTKPADTQELQPGERVAVRQESASVPAPRPEAPSPPARREPVAETPAAPVESAQPPLVEAPVEEPPEPAARPLRDAMVERLPVDREMSTGMMLSFEIEPKEAAERLVIRFDRIVIGRAADWNASRRGGRAYAVNEPGPHIVTFLVDGSEVYRIRIEAQAGGGGPTPITANLPQFGRRSRRGSR